MTTSTDRRAGARGGPLLVLAFFLLASACSGGSSDREAPPEAGSAEPGAEGREGGVASSPRSDRPREGTDEDWAIFRRTVTGAWDEGLDTVPMGEAMVRIGETFVGTPYAPGTLEVAGREDVVVNFEAFDCVTLVENVLALTRFVGTNDPSVLDSDLRSRDLYRGYLRQIRYRGGRVNGYSSRLHYFSDWIRDNEERGVVRDVTEELGGELNPKAIDYMSMHPEAYPQLADPSNLAAIEQTEFFLSGLDRFKIPEMDIPVAAPGIQDGDIIAMTSTLEGLDVAHTGIAMWQGGELHLLNAPLVGAAVEVSELPLAERVQRLETQDGIRVVRPLDPLASGNGAGGR